MYSFWFVSIYGIVMLVIGAAASWGCGRVRAGIVAAGRGDSLRETAAVLARLQELTAQVAFDVDTHNEEVEEINDELQATKHDDRVTIVDAVARLVEANQRMQEKLASTENRLQEQAQLMAVQIAEARTDALTRLANRRALDDELGRRHAEFQRNGKGFSFLLVDIDHFKKFNDTYGHQAGDEVLRSVAKTIRRAMRGMDLVARYGGEEFAVVLPDAKLQDACIAAERARRAIAKQVVRISGTELSVTASLGVAEIQPEETTAALTNRSDQALYAAKAGGRDCVYGSGGQTTWRFNSDTKAKQTQTLNEPNVPETASAVLRSDERVFPDRNKAAEAKDGDQVGHEDDSFGLLDRSTFCRHVLARVAEWKRGGPPLSVILVEATANGSPKGAVDVEGRRGLGRLLAKMVEAVVRDMDQAGYYSPGRFAVMLPSAGLADAVQVAKRIREQFRSSPGGAHPSLALNIGVAEIGGDDDLVSLFKRAENALDSADQRGGGWTYYHDGRNCVPITTLAKVLDILE